MDGCSARSRTLTWRHQHVGVHREQLLVLPSRRRARVRTVAGEGAAEPNGLSRMTSWNVLTTVDKAWQDGKPIQAKTHAIYATKGKGAGKTEDKFDAKDRLVAQKRIVRGPVGEGDGNSGEFPGRGIASTETRNRINRTGLFPNFPHAGNLGNPPTVP